MFLSTWSVHRLLFEGAITIQEMPVLARCLGFDGVELEDIFFETTSASYLRMLKEAIGKQRQKVVIAISNDFTVRSPTQYRRQLERARQFMEIAGGFRSRLVRVLMGSTDTHRYVLKGVIRGLASLTPQAEMLGIKLAIENHDRLSNDPAIMLNVIEKVGRGRFGLCLDTGNLKSLTRYDAMRQLAPHALMVHAKAYHFRPNGEEKTIDYRRCFRILRSARYRGPVVIEFDGPGDQIIGSMKTKALVERYAGLL